jgi:hypothetical protein
MWPTLVVMARIDAKHVLDEIAAAAELRVAMMDQQAQRLLVILERHQQVARLLGCPGACWVHGAGDELDPAALKRDEKEHVDSPQPGGLDGEEITGERRRLRVGGGSSARRARHAAAPDENHER